MSKKEPIKIALGVIRSEDKVLLAQRTAQQDFAGLWEFPGGKVEAGEAVDVALKREILEEVGLETAHWQPLIEFKWAYETRILHFFVFETTTFEGEAQGKEGQMVAWHNVDSLRHLSFPPANRGIVNAIQLPELYMISGQFDNPIDALDRLETALQDGIKLCQLRAKSLPKLELITLAQKATKLCHQFEAKILLNAPVEWLAEVPEADGIQLASNEAERYDKRPIPNSKWLGISTHNPAQIQHAQKLQADFLLLSPVKETTSHPGEPAIGWQTFSLWAENTPIPVYALGGMKTEDRTEAKLNGAQGIAAISGLWPLRL